MVSLAEQSPTISWILLQGTPENITTMATPVYNLGHHGCQFYNLNK
jgi:hypothetical protein